MSDVLKLGARLGALVGLTLVGASIGLWARSGALDVIFALVVANAALAAVLQQTLPRGPNAVQGIASSDVLRNQSQGSWKVKSIAYPIATTAGAALSGAILGWTSGSLPEVARLVTILSLAGVFAIVGVSQTVGGRVALLQCNTETPQAWLQAGPVGWALKNGAALGCGVGTRIGLWSWYLVPLGSFIVADPLTGAGVYGTYGLVRGLAAVSIYGVSVLLQRRIAPSALGWWFLERYPLARVVSAGQLLTTGVSITVALA